jgi:hypothetical protein
MPPPSPSSARASSYHGLINAKSAYVPNNGYHANERAEHLNNAFHKVNMECFSYFGDEAHLIACDNKQTVSLSRTAVDRHVQSKRIFNVENTPANPTHDYPATPESAGETIIPSGYLVLQNRGNSIETYIDSDGRKRVAVPVAGPFHVFNRSNHYYTADIILHLDDLKTMLDTKLEKKGVLALAVDSGPDWNWFRSFNLLLAYGLFWKNMGLCALQCFSYLPESHHKLQVEHAWAPLVCFSYALFYHSYSID